jgi:outer membrane lipoprotein-sorting protein
MMQQIRRTRLALILAVGLCFGATAPSPAAEPAPKAEFETARALLEALEEADEGIETLSADIRYDKLLKLQGDVHRREGDLLFRTARAGQARINRAFEINFTSLKIGGRLERDPETWIFDGRWLVEMRAARKQFIKREIAGAGQQLDPLAIGEGPMPIPIGQKAEEVLARYDARLAPYGESIEPEDVGRLKAVADTWQIVLTPKAGRNAEDKFKEIRIWYSKSGSKRLLPRMARTLSRSGDISYVQLINIRTNVELPPRAFDVTPPPPEENWSVQIEPLPAPDLEPDPRERK